MSDDDTLAIYERNTGGFVILNRGNKTDNPYWYSTMAPSDYTCFNLSKYTAITFTMKAPFYANLCVFLNLRESSCFKSGERSTSAFLPLSNYVIFDGRVHSVTIPLKDFNANLSLTESIMLTEFPQNAEFVIDDISLEACDISSCRYVIQLW